MDRKQFYATKNPGPRYQSVVFSHPAFDASIALVADVFEEVTLGGVVHIPAPMSIKPPDQSGDPTAKMTISFPRVVVGREFKRQLRLVRASGSRAPIAVTYAVYLDDLSTPSATWPMFASEDGGIAFGTQAVQVTATIDNPMRRSAALIYDPAVFTGLELI